MKISYCDRVGLNPKNLALLNAINTIITSYQAQGYRLTLRQLYYQLVSRGVIPNQQKEYAKLSSILTKGRMGGIVDWDAIEDRLRVPSKPAGWNSPSEIIKACASQYRRDRMEGQGTQIEVWVEKDALSGVLKRATEPFGVALMVNRGYSSTSAMHDAFQRFQKEWANGKYTVVLYLGDHDPSGLDMARDIRARIDTFANGDAGDHFEIKRIALTKEQIDEYTPPPNPAKFSDPRANDYISEHGKVSWEVDALPPDVLNSLVTDEIEGLIDPDLFVASKKKEQAERKRLELIAKRESHVD